MSVRSQVTTTTSSLVLQLLYRRWLINLLTIKHTVKSAVGAFRAFDVRRRRACCVYRTEKSTPRIKTNSSCSRFGIPLTYCQWCISMNPAIGWTENNKDTSDHQNVYDCTYCLLLDTIIIIVIVIVIVIVIFIIIIVAVIVIVVFVIIIIIIIINELSLSFYIIIIIIIISLLSSWSSLPPVFVTCIKR